MRTQSSLFVLHDEAVWHFAVFDNCRITHALSVEDVVALSALWPLMKINDYVFAYLGHSMSS
jgi:hypothetical protein